MQKLRVSPWLIITLIVLVAKEMGFRIILNMELSQKCGGVEIGNLIWSPRGIDGSVIMYVRMLQEAHQRVMMVFNELKLIFFQGFYRQQAERYCLRSPVPFTS